jgi:acetyl esterase/lipase
LFDPLTGAGFAWFSIDYRLAPSVHFPEAMKTWTAPFAG